MTTVTVTVPATTANLGPGFDCIGAALTLYNQFRWTKISEAVPHGTQPTQDTVLDLTLMVRGTDAEKISGDRRNLAYQSFLRCYEKLGQTPPRVELEIDLAVPLARGLGSSATAIIGGLVGANVLAGKVLSSTEILELAIAIEGHPDNVVPAFLGNCQLSVGEGEKWQICEVPWHPELVPVAAIPNFELSTEAARAVLPTEISRSDAIYNMGRLGLLTRALATHHPDWLKVALGDRLHQPYRKSLIPGYEMVQTAARKAGAYGTAISGAGPTILALCAKTQAEQVAQAMVKAWQEKGLQASAHVLQIDTAGTKVSD